MKIYKLLIIFTLLFISFTLISAQAMVSFQSAQDAFDSSEYEKTLQLLQRIEKDTGKTPRIESLRAVTLKELNRPKEAYESLLVYFQLTAKLDLSNNEAHQSLIELRDELKSQLERKLQNEKDKLQAERNSKAEKSVSDGSAQNTTKKSDPLEELELWNKVKESNTAADYYLFIERFPDGRFAAQARTKMNQVGDSEWNELKNSTDPIKFREYIKKYPNSPFIEQAKVRYEILAKELVEWELIKESQNADDFLRYADKFPNSAFYMEARNKAAEIDWSRIQGSTKSDDLESFLQRHPNSAITTTVKQKLEELHWILIKDSSNLKDFIRFLRKYPTSSFAEIAQSKIYENSVFRLLTVDKYHDSGDDLVEFRFIKGGIQAIANKKPTHKNSYNAACSDIIGTEVEPWDERRLFYVKIKFKNGVKVYQTDDRIWKKDDYETRQKWLNILQNLLTSLNNYCKIQQ